MEKSKPLTPSKSYRTLNFTNIDKFQRDAMEMDYRNDDPYRRNRAIRAHCVDCSGWQLAEVRKCTVYRCPLWPWRMGKLDRTDYATKEENQ